MLFLHCQPLEGTSGMVTCICYCFCFLHYAFLAGATYSPENTVCVFQNVEFFFKFF